MLDILGLTVVFEGVLLDILGVVVLMALVSPGVGVTLLLGLIEGVRLNVTVTKLDLMRDDELGMKRDDELGMKRDDGLGVGMTIVEEFLPLAFAEENATRRMKQAK